MLNFNSHAHVERDYANDDIKIWNDDFNSHAHVERDRHRGIQWRQSDISTHTLTWSVTTAEQHWLYPNYHFNSHAHVERDNSLKAIDIIISISTHTLTWSVTTYSFDDCKQSAFQLTRSRGA